MVSCPSDNAQAIDQSSFFDFHTWDPHRIGWLIAGVCSIVTVVISFISVMQHCRSYTKPREQRQILRILYMPPVYAIISFFSYRFFRQYTYYSLVEVAYEAITITAFLLLLIEYVADTATGHIPENAISRKDKRSLPMPFCCWRYRPTKPYFMYTVKWSVMQYVIIRPLVSIAGIITQALGVLCESGGFSIHFASVYLQAVDFVSISVALYGLLLFYGLTKDELAGRRPLAKFLCIKLIVMFTWYQSFVFSALEGRVIQGTEFWTPTNIADGLNALAICIEMVIFSALMWWAYPAGEYKLEGARATGIWRPLWDSINYYDFYREIKGSLVFFIRYILNKPDTHSDSSGKPRMDFGRAFGLDDSAPGVGAGAPGHNKLRKNADGRSQRPKTRGGGGGGGIMSESPVDRRGGLMTSDDENIRLAPYSTDEARSSTSRHATDTSLVRSSPSPTNEYQDSPRAL